MYKGKQLLRNLLFESFQERNEDFFYLAPDIIGSVTNSNMDMNKKLFVISFMTTDGREMDLRVKDESVNNWFDKNSENLGMIDFVKEFISKSKQEDEVEKLEEIVDEYGDIMGDDDKPNNSNNSMVGNSKFDSDKTVRQTIARTRRFYGDLGLGVVVW